MRFLGRLTAALILAASAHANGQAQSAAGRKTTAGTIEGDAYLVMKSGDTKKGAGNTLYLIRETPELHLDMLSTCQVFNLSAVPLYKTQKAVNDSIIAYRSNTSLWATLVERSSRISSELAGLRGTAVVSTRKIILEAAIDTTGTGVSGHYRFTGVQPGQYFVYGWWPIADSTYVWYAPVTVAASQTSKRDLDNSVEVRKTIYCGA